MTPERGAGGPGPGPAPADRRRRTLLGVLAVVGALVVGALVGLVAIAATDGDDDRAATHGTGGGRSASDEGGDLRWEDCRRGMSCTTLEVPLDHADPDGRTIELAVARRAATGEPADRLGILVLNPGGPGASGIDLLAGAALVGDLEGLNERFDLIAWDPRGVGGSTGLRCDEATVDAFRRLDPDPDDRAEQEELHEAAGAVADSCAEADPALAASLGTDQTVEDIDALRAALGEDRLSWLGISYGTLLGQRYADAHPDRVRAMVLDGVVDPAVGVEGLLAAQAEGFEAFLDATVPPGLYEAVERRLEDEPLRVGRDLVGPAELAVGTFMAAYDPALTARLTGVLEAARDGDGRTLAVLADTYRASGDFGAYLATLCADGPYPRTDEGAEALAADLAATAPRAGAPIVNELLPCTSWVATDPPDPAPVAATGSPTILVVGNRGDVATPLAQAEAVAERLADAVLVVHEGAGHASYASSPCVQALVATYLVELVPPADGTTCRD